MVDPFTALGAAGSVVGIVSLGLQLAQLMQAQIDGVRNADERLVQVVFEIRATAAGLNNLQEVLLYERKHSGRKTLRNKDRSDIISIVIRCNQIFRKIIVLIAKSGKETVLAQVDDFQRKIDEQGQGRQKHEPTLDIELSSMEHILLWWRLPRMEKYRADLNGLTLTLLFLLTTLTLRRRKISRWRRTKTGLINFYLWTTHFVGIRQIERLEGHPPDIPESPAGEPMGQTQREAGKLHLKLLRHGKAREIEVEE